MDFCNSAWWGGVGVKSWWLPAHRNMMRYCKCHGTQSFYYLHRHRAWNWIAVSREHANYTTACVGQFLWLRFREKKVHFTRINCLVAEISPFRIPLWKCRALMHPKKSTAIFTLCFQNILPASRHSRINKKEEIFSIQALLIWDSKDFLGKTRSNKCLFSSGKLHHESKTPPNIVTK